MRGKIYFTKYTFFFDPPAFWSPQMPLVLLACQPRYSISRTGVGDFRDSTSSKKAGPQQACGSENDHLPFVQAHNTKDISQVSPRFRRIVLELAELDKKLTWAEASSMLHMDAMSRHPVDPAEDLGLDLISDEHQQMS